MKEYETKKMRRVNKSVAKKLYDSGLDVYVCACNLNPDSIWNVGLYINKAMYNESFNEFVNSYTYYNCNHETGYYLAFYIDKKTYIHFTFIDGSNPYVFWGDSLECYQELKKWGKHYTITPLKNNFFSLGVIQ